MVAAALFGVDAVVHHAVLVGLGTAGVAAPAGQ
jgi:hypothetical protein